jgi:hypothetical protein
MTQDQQDELDRSIKLSRTNTMTSTEFTVTATNRANKIFAFDSSGELAVTQEIGTFTGNFAASTAYNVRDLIKDTSTNNIFIVNEAHTSSGSEPLTTNANSAKYDLIVDAASATTSASAAASSATAAAASATSAASSASTATTQASNASSSASTASTQASNASSSATAAAASAATAAAVSGGSIVADTTPQLGGDLDVVTHDIISTSNRDIDLAPNGTGKVVVKGNDNPGTIVFNCESNSHGQTVKSQPHSASVTNVLTLPPGGDQEIVGASATQTLTNKTIDASQLSGTVANARLDAQLQDVAGLAVTDSGFIVGNGSNFVLESGATARTSLGLAIGSDVQAFDADIVAKDTNNTFTAAQRGSTDTDTSNTGSVTLDFNTNQNFVLTFTGNVTLANPSTEAVGQSGFIVCIQDGTGSRTLSLGTDYETAGGSGITLSTAASSTDIIPYIVVASNRILLGAPQLAFS